MIDLNTKRKLRLRHWSEDPSNYRVSMWSSFTRWRKFARTRMATLFLSPGLIVYRRSRCPVDTYHPFILKCMAAYTVLVLSKVAPPLSTCRFLYFTLKSRVLPLQPTAHHHHLPSTYTPPKHPIHLPIYPLGIYPVYGQRLQRNLTMAFSAAELQKVCLTTSPPEIPRVIG